MLGRRTSGGRIFLEPRSTYLWHFSRLALAIRMAMPRQSEAKLENLLNLSVTQALFRVLDLGLDCDYFLS